MKKITVYFGILIVVLLVAGCKSNAAPSDSENSIENSVEQAKMENGMQVATLSWGKLNYAPSTIKLKEGIKTRITADTERLVGCYSSIVIPELGVQKTFTEADNTVEFMPNKKGTFNFGCSMGMGKGIIVVE